MIDDLIALAGEAVAHAKKLGADAVHAVAADGRSTEISILDGKIEKVEQSEARDISLKVFVGKSSASISGSVLTKDAIHRLAENALRMAQLAPPDPYAGIADPDQLAKNIPELDLAANDLPDPQKLEEIAKRAEAAGMAVTGVTKSSGAGASRSETSVGIVISNGFAQGYRRTGVGVSMSAIAGEGLGMQRDYDYSSAIHYVDLRDPEIIGRTAGERAVERVNPRKVKSQSVPVIYDRRVASSLIGHLLGAINGAAIARGTSFLKESMGQQVFGPHITIVEDPHMLRGHGSRPFDGEGLACTKRNLIADGVLTGWILDLRAARQLGLAPTGQGSRGGPDQGHHAGALRHRTHRLLDQQRDGRLQPRCFRILDRERRTHLPRERDHHRRKPEGHVQDHPSGFQPRVPLLGVGTQLPGRGPHHCRRLTPGFSST